MAATSPQNITKERTTCSSALFFSSFNFIFHWSLCPHKTKIDSEIPRDFRSRPDIRPFTLKAIHNFESDYRMDHRPAFNDQFF